MISIVCTLALAAATLVLASLPQGRCPEGVGANNTCRAGGGSAGVELLQREAEVAKVAVSQLGMQGELHMKLVEEVPTDIQWNPSQGRRLALCHHRVVEQTCRRLNGARPGASTTVVSVALLRDQLSANDSTMSEALVALGLSVNQSEVDCRELCALLVQYVTSIGGHLPPSTDVACYAVDGATHCDADADPYNLSRMLATAESDDLPDDGPRIAPDEGRHAGSEVLPDDGHRSASGEGVDSWALNSSGSAGPSLVQIAISAADDHSSQHRRIARIHSAEELDPVRAAGTSAGFPSFSPKELLERIAGVFRMYPSSDGDVSISLPVSISKPRVGLVQGSGTHRASSDVKRRIAASNAQARAWASAVSGEMEAQQTAEFRKKWFGGEGSSPTDEEVRIRVLRTMNFIDKVLLDRVHYVYPGEEASDTACGGSTVAYVWRWQTGKKGYVETEGPVCDESRDPFANRCGTKQDGKYVVYLCKRWYEKSGQNSQIATLVHEAAHHAGPRDVTYSTNQMQEIPRSRQVDNAANYEHFAQDVAQTSWGCADSEKVDLPPLRCSPSPCQCPAFSELCGDRFYGSRVREMCPATCGDCQGQTDGSGGDATAAPQPTSAPPTSTTAPPISTTARPTPTTAPPATQVPTTTLAPEAPSTTPPATTDCSEAKGLRRIKVSRWQTITAPCTWFSRQGFCDKENVRTACPISCEFCSVPGCEDDPLFSIMTRQGEFTCEMWRKYHCWEEVKSSCPSACEVDRCTR